MYLDEEFRSPLWCRWAEDHYELDADTVTRVAIEYLEGGWLSDVTYESGSLELAVYAGRRLLCRRDVDMGELLPSVARFAQAHPGLDL